MERYNGIAMDKIPLPWYNSSIYYESVGGEYVCFLIAKPDNGKADGSDTGVACGPEYPAADAGF
jgi:hypothetical protein